MLRALARVICFSIFVACLSLYVLFWSRNIDNVYCNGKAYN